jgi:hypothetical protein
MITILVVLASVSLAARQNWVLEIMYKSSDQSVRLVPATIGKVVRIHNNQPPGKKNTITELPPQLLLPSVLGLSLIYVAHRLG